MKITLERFGFGRDSTLGLLSIEGQPQCFTIEDERRRVKVAGETCIPLGSYVVKLRREGGMHAEYRARFPWHRGMLWLQDVPGFEWAYLHVGNTPADSRGCPLLVTTPLVTPLGEFRGAASVPAYEQFYKKVLEALEGERLVMLAVQERQAA